MRFGYFGIIVQDFEKSLNFYTKQLGMTESRRGTTKHGSWIMLEDKESRQKFFLISLNADSPLRAKSGGKNTVLNMGFVVTDVKKTFSDLVSNGVPRAVEPYTDGGSWASYIEDPDGNKIELYSS